MCINTHTVSEYRCKIQIDTDIYYPPEVWKFAPEKLPSQKEHLLFLTGRTVKLSGGVAKGKYLMDSTCSNLSPCPTTIQGSALQLVCCRTWRRRVQDSTCWDWFWKVPFLPKIMVQWKTYPKWKGNYYGRYTHFLLNHDYGRKGMTSWDVSAWDVRLLSVGPSWGNCPSPSELLWLGLSADPSENLQKITWHILRWSRKKTQKAPLGVDGGFFVSNVSLKV